MRYVCYKKTISKIVDEEIEDEVSIKALLSSLWENEITCSLTLKDNIFHNKVRITGINETGFDYVVFTTNATLRKSSQFKDVLYLEMTAIDSILAVLKPKIERWNLLGTEDLEI